MPPSPWPKLFFYKQQHQPCLQKAMDISSRGAETPTRIISLLRRCIQEDDLPEAQRIKRHVLDRHSHLLDGFLGDYLVVALAKCGAADEALSTSYSLPSRSVFSWTSIIASMVDSGYGHEALRISECMQQEGVLPDAFTFVSLFKACAMAADVGCGKKLHLMALCRGFACDLYVSTAMVTMYSKCGHLEAAEAAFRRISCRNVVSWSAMLSAYVDRSEGFRALLLYRQMCEEGAESDHLALMLAIQACTIIAENEENLREIAMEIGCALHSSAIRKSPMLDAFLRNTLVNLYGRCGSSISQAEHAFDALRHRDDLVAWNAMLLAYVEQGDGQKALQLYVHMQEAAGMNPDRLTTIFALQACCVLITTVDEEAERELFAAQEIGKSLHIDACKKGFDVDEFVGCSLMKMYGRTDAIAEVESVFGGLSSRDVASWNTMLSAYVELMHKSDLRSALLFGQRALCVYRQMEEEHVSDPLSCVLALQACTNLVCEDGFVEGQSFKALALEVGRALHADACKKEVASDLQVGRALHADARKKGFASDLDVGRALHGDACKKEVASDLEVGRALHANACKKEFASDLEVGRALHANARCDGFASDLEFERALHADAHKKGFASNLDVGRALHADACKKEVASDHEVGRVLHADGRKKEFASNLEVGRTLRADGRKKDFASDLQVGRALHADARTKGFASDLDVGRASLHADARCDGFASDLEFGRASLHADPRKKGFASDLDVGRALHADARCDGFTSDLEFGRASLHADARCDGFASDLEFGRASLHADARKKGFATDAFVSNAVISLYGRCGAIVEAEHAFSSLLRRDCASWTSMLSTYVEQGLPERCLQLYTQMIEDGMRPDAWTYVVLLQACSAVSGDRIEPSVSSTDSYRLDIGSSLHASIAARGFASDSYVSSTLVSMYGKCCGASIEEAENVFGSLLGPKLVSWTAMLSAYLEQGHASKALDVYREMGKRGICSNDVALNCALQACNATGSLEMCREIHFGLVSSGCDRVHWVSATLVHAYGSCTSMRDGQAFFGTLPEPGIVAWNACISGHAAEGGFSRSLDAFEELKAEGVLPDEVTYAAILSACGHVGAVDRGLECFESMSAEHGLVPGAKHYCSMVDLLGRVGDLQGLCCFLERIPVETDLRFWVCVLGSCCTHGSSELARYAFHHATQQAAPRT